MNRLGVMPTNITNLPLQEYVAVTDETDRLVIPWQTQGWVDALEALKRGRGYWLTAFSDDEPLATTCIITTAINRGRFNSWPFEDLMERFFRVVAPITTCAGGITPLNGQFDVEIAAHMMRAAYDAGGAVGSVMFKSSLGFEAAFEEQTRVGEILAHDGFNVSKWATLLIDLEPAPDRILASFSATRRNLVRRSIRDGITVRRLTMDDVSDYRRARHENNVRAGLKGYHWDLSKIEIIDRAAPEMFNFFGAFDPDGELLASAGVVLSGRLATSISLLQDNRSKRERIPVFEALHWAIINWAREHGCTVYDLNGIHPNPEPKSRAAGIRFFKERWGGRYVEYLTIEKYYPSFKSRLLRWLRESS